MNPAIITALCLVFLVACGTTRADDGFNEYAYLEARIAALEKVEGDTEMAAGVRKLRADMAWYDNELRTSLQIIWDRLHLHDEQIREAEQHLHESYRSRIVELEEKVRTLTQCVYFPVLCN